MVDLVLFVMSYDQLRCGWLRARWMVGNEEVVVEEMVAESSKELLIVVPRPLKARDHQDGEFPLL